MTAQSRGETSHSDASMADVDGICDAFEADWIAGNTPQIELYLDQGNELRRAALLRELLMADWEMRTSQGLQVDVTTYHRRFPSDGQILAELWEEWRDLQRQTHDTTRIAQDPSHAGGPQDGAQHEAAVWQGGEVRNLGRFELLEPVGAGAFGTVYKARDPELDRIVAIKVPRSTLLSDSSFRDRFFREARSAAKLRHPSIVSVHDSGQHDGMPFLISDFVEGVTLAEYLSANRIPPSKAAELVAELADALQYAHANGVIHRDVKPSNVMLDGRLRPHLMDFGLAKRVTGNVTMTLDGQILGTPAYMSPEQARGEGHRVDGRTDEYSLGVILYELLTGVVPFRGTTQMVLHQVLHEEPRRPRTLSGDIPRDLETICLRAIAKEPAGRYLTAGEMAEDLRRFLAGEPIRARRIGPAERLWRWCRRKPALAGTTAALVILLVAIAIGGTAVVSILLFVIAVGGVVAAVKFRRQAQQEKLLRSVADANLYYHRIALGHREILVDNLGEGQKLLAACPEPLRDWEWRYLERLSLVDPVKPIVADRAIFSLSFSPDGKYIAAGQQDGKVGIFDLATGERWYLEGHEKYVFSVMFHPQGEYLASAGADRKVILWNTRKRQIVFTKSGHEGRYAGTAYALAFSPDGKSLAAPSDEETIAVWSVPDGTRTREFTGPARLVGSLAFSPNGRLLVAGSFDNSVTLWDVHTGTLRHKLEGHVGPVTSVAFSPPDGRYVATTSYDRQAKLWDVATRKEISTLLGHVGLVVGLAFSRDGKRLATMGGEDRVVKIWDPLTHQEVLSLKGHASFCQCVTTSRDGWRLASTGTDGTIRLWDAGPVDRDANGWLVEMHHDNEVWGVTFSPDGNLVASAGWDQTVRIWKAINGRSLRTFRTRSVAFCVRFSPRDSDRLAATAGMSLGGDTHLYMWDTATGTPVFPPIEHNGNPFCVEFSPDGKYVLKSAQDQSSRHFVQVRDAETGGLLGSFGDHLQDIWAIKFSPDSQTVATGGTDYVLKLWRWNSTTLTEIAEIGRAELPKVGFADMFTFSPNGAWLLTGADDATVQVRSAASGKLIHSLPGHTGQVFAVAFRPDGRFFASAGEDTTIRIWDATSDPPQEVHKLRGHTGLISSLAFSPDGQRLVSGSRDRTVKIWNLASILREGIE